jgi:hypothetical protein
MIKRSTKTPKPTIVYGWGDGEEELYKQLAKSSVDARLGTGDRPTLTKSIINVLNGPNGSIERLAFETDPTQINNYAGVYKNKMRLVPDSVLKRIAIQDCLVASIVRARTNHISAHGRPKKDRFSTGFEFKPNTGVLEKMTAEEKKEFHAKLEKGIKRLNSCGDTEGLKEAHQASFAEYLALSARSAVVCGRIATEIVNVDDPISPSKKKFHHFVATDAGTIYKATTDHLSQESVRHQAYHTLCRVLGKKLEEERFTAGEYAWVQVIEGTPKQVFTNDEMKCYNFYAVPDVELDGYPVTPIDTVITAITTHINITTHNKMYFQSGRATRGMLVLKSDDIKPETISQLKQQFNASINSSAMAFRMPVFGCPTDGEITWQPIDNSGSRDMEFQYLSDMNTREIMTAFMMGPDELPGYSYLSRGTASQALSECLHPDSLVLTRTGVWSLDFILRGSDSEDTEIWDGYKFSKARVFKVGKKQVAVTVLKDGKSLITSPDHRFMVVDRNVTDKVSVVWRLQSELKIDDLVVVSELPEDESECLSGSFHMAEVSYLAKTEDYIDMVDVTMDNEGHAFVVNGIVTHNSNSEYKLEAARDVGIRPLLTHFEDFINADLLPLVAPDLVGLVKVCLVGLEASTPEKEASDLTAQSQVYMTYNDIMQRVEKATFEKDLFGEFPLNPQYQQVLDKYLTVGQILARFGGIKDADKDPKWDYCRDPFFFQQQQLMMEKQQMQQAAQQPQQEQGEAQGSQEQSQAGQGEAKQQDNGPNNIGKAIEQAYDLMQKSEKNLPPEKRKLLAQHKKTVEFFTKGLEADSKDAINEILDIAKKFTPRK